MSAMPLRELGRLVGVHECPSCTHGGSYQLRHRPQRWTLWNDGCVMCDECCLELRIGSGGLPGAIDNWLEDQWYRAQYRVNNPEGEPYP